MQYLQPIYDTRKSFYGKATVEVTPASVILESYHTKICELEIGGQLNIFPAFYSMTTMRHAREFLKQSGVDIDATLKECGFKSLKQAFEHLERMQCVFNRHGAYWSL